MDGMLGHHPYISTPEGRAPLAGILYAEDFDELPPVPSAAEPDIELIGAEPAITQADLEQACLAAVEQARVQWEQEAEHQRQRMLAAIAGSVAAGRGDAMRHAAELAEGTVTAMLSTLAGALPMLCREHGPSQARALVAHLLPSLRAEPRISIRVHPSLVSAVENDLQAS